MKIWPPALNLLHKESWERGLVEPDGCHSIPQVLTEAALACPAPASCEYEEEGR